MAEKNPFERLVRQVSDQYDSDIVIYVGPIDRPYDDNFITRVKGWKRRRNVILILRTLGGDPNSAYRIARCLQQEYSTVEEASITPASTEKPKGLFRVLVDTRCKSAGTILATGANAIMFSDYGELGPIDVQLRKGDEIGERSSGLTPMHSLESLQQLALKHFQDCFKSLRFGESAFSTKMAAEIAREMAVGLYSPIYAQIDPLRIGEFDRAMRISADYVTRIGKGNLKEDALKKLLTSYPSHGFVIDKKEARELFNDVQEPTEELLNVAEITRTWWSDDYLLADTPLFLYLTTDAVLRDDEPEQQEQTEEGPDANDDGKNATDDGVA